MVKLIDYGFSVVVANQQRLKVFCGTPSYMSPEIVRKHEYDGKPVDMWALGVLLYVMLTEHSRSGEFQRQISTRRSSEVTTSKTTTPSTRMPAE